MRNRKTTTLIILATALLVASSAARAARIEDITDIEGLRGNTIQGMGLVVGLDGTGDSSALTRRMFANFLRRTEGLALSPDDLTTNNVAAVMVKATLGPEDRCGSRIQATVSSTGASSLQRAQPGW